ASALLIRIDTWAAGRAARAGPGPGAPEAVPTPSAGVMTAAPWGEGTGSGRSRDPIAPFPRPIDHRVLPLGPPDRRGDEPRPAANPRARPRLRWARPSPASRDVRSARTPSPWVTCAGSPTTRTQTTLTQGIPLIAAARDAHLRALMVPDITGTGRE